MEIKFTKEWCENMARQEGDHEVGVGCFYCDGSGKIETDNNGPIVDCPICQLHVRSSSNDSK